ncbi:DUF711 family protein [Pelolinea submarina]|uniref:DUF711 family protein n=1 Tax=Pelolinea submarina TaxID=913107 RepID=A0A347ZV19_9CHLR|nr:DUF711 family protein [Pelolinea submarina]REG10264.1 hypothetical protein DFR64_0117 [Pelolinea submarina]BBB49150.1 hypothetical protein Pelsub_P2381 [Pelolinea submarina]
MKIRSITCFCNPTVETFKSDLDTLTQLKAFCKEEFERLGWEVQSARLSTTSFGGYTTSEDAVPVVQELEKQTLANGFGYLSIGPARISNLDDYALIPQILGATENVFCSAMMTHHNRGISAAAVKACAKVISDSAKLSADGFANLRFCAMSHVHPFTPFFPGSYSYGSEPAFALAIQSADAALEAFEGAADADQGSRRLVAAIDAATRALVPVARAAVKKFGVPFKGFDFSLAPYPEEWCSLGKAFEKLGVPSIGYMGSLTAAAILTNALDQGTWLRTGYNGLMLPVLEDSILADRSQNDHFTIKDLLLYSAVCGTGLDTVPLPGDIAVESIVPLLFDISALSLRLNKPLTARLMPVPGLKSGDQTAFTFDMFKNGRIMDYPAAALSGVLSSSEWLDIQKRVRLN